MPTLLLGFRLTHYHCNSVTYIMKVDLKRNYVAFEICILFSTTILKQFTTNNLNENDARFFMIRKW